MKVAMPEMNTATLYFGTITGTRCHRNHAVATMETSEMDSTLHTVSK